MLHGAHPIHMCLTTTNKKKTVFRDMAHYVKPSVAQKPDLVILHARANNHLISYQTRSDISYRIIMFARG